ncbi:ATP-binding cassette domain-containing protein [Aliivibrio fischeri]|uniref:ATP-binding cassette domain-containing protein n=1 Tax=Aliivibrio fischeri TaxID=668 RepID=UPI0007C49B12|nr:ATP-binding cassette domain-containing protein [Aliivibrio fischeri]
MDTLIAFDEIRERLHQFKQGHLHTRYSENPLLLGLAYTLVTLEWEGTPDILSDAFLTEPDHCISFNKTLTRLGYQCVEEKITHSAQLLTIDCPSFIVFNQQNYILLNFDNDILYLYDYENDVVIENKVNDRLIATTCSVSKYSRLFREAPPESQDKRNWIKHVFYHYNTEFKNLAILSLFISLLGTFQPFFIMGVYTLALTADSISTLYWLTSGAIVIAGMEFFLKKQRMAILNTSGQELAKYISYQVISKLLWLPYSLTSNAATSSQLARLKDIDQFRHLVTAESSLSYFDLPFIIIFLIAIFMMSSSAAITVIIGISLMILFCVYARYIYMQATSKSSRANAMVSYQWNEVLTNVSSIQKLPLISIIKSRFHSALTQRLKDSHHVAVTNAKIQQTGSSLIQVIGTTSIVTAVLAVMAGDANPGAMLAIIILVWKTLTPIMGIYNSLAKIDTIKASTAQINALMSLEDDKNRIEKSPPIDQFNGNISVSALSHRYQGINKGLTNLSFSVKAGSKVSVCAPSGCGKTTLMNILGGIEPRFQGRLLFDGYNISQFNNFRFRNSICYIPFEMHLYHGTVQANYTMYNGYIPPEFIDNMLNFLDLLPYLPQGRNTLLSSDFISSLPDGIHRKLILAIGIGYCRKKVIILDEPFAGSEDENSKYLTSLFSEYLATSTVIFTTTCRTMVATSDQCLLLEQDGSQKFYGAPDKVLQAAPPILN